MILNSWANWHIANSDLQVNANEKKWFIALYSPLAVVKPLINLSVNINKFEWGHM